MASWKLTRQIFGNEEYTLSEGDVVTIGRSTDNTITLCSMVVSRNHCSLKIERNQIIVTDLKSSNGVFVGSTKIPPNVPYVAKHSDTIGIGWDTSISSTGLDNTQKYLFKVAREHKACDDIERRLSGLDTSTNVASCNLLQVNSTKAIKRKTNFNISPKKEKKLKSEIDDEIIHIKSDSDNEKLDSDFKKPKLEPITKTPQIQCIPIEKIKNENEYLQLEAFNVKQEYLAYDDEPIELDSDSDRESEQWLVRLSQNSPGKPLKRLSQQKKEEPEDSSYSQLEDFLDLDLWSQVEDDVILIEPSTNEEVKSFTVSDEILNFNDHLQDELQNNLDATIQQPEQMQIINLIENVDETDGFCNEQSSNQKQQIPIIDAPKTQKETKLTTQLAEPPDHLLKKQTTNKLQETKTKNSLSKRTKSKKESTSRRHISKSDKEARKQKLKELAIKEKEKDNSTEITIHDSNKSIVHAKVTATSRSAFLGDTIQIVKPLNRKEKIEESSKLKKDSNEKKNHSKDKKTTKDNNHRNKSNEGTTTKHVNDSRVPLKNVKPLSDREDVSLHEKTILGKPFNKVEPLSHKQSNPKKSVRFSDAGPKVHVFEIEPGNKMKKIRMMKTSLLDIRHVPMFSLDKIALMKILRWNPQWLEEQISNDDCPPILGHNKQLMSIFHSFSNHAQYAQQIGDLLLMEIWECLTIAYMKVREQRNDIVMRIENIPPAPPLENSFDLLNISVNVSVPSSEAKKVPRVGAILLVVFGPENARCQRFFFVHNVRCLPSPPNNINSFFSLSLQSAHSEKILSLKQGEVVLAKTLAHISNELMLFEAMEYMANSPLGEIILQPKPYHFPKVSANPELNTKSPWTMTLNPSQQMAVRASVSAALSNLPSIQMVQGPPGTGKSSVICSMVMSYFYDAKSRRNQNHGKILICATSNAAVDELVIRLLKIRQTLPKEARFRMVRVGRAEAMHPAARDVSSQQLARRDRARHTHHTHHPHHPHHPRAGLAQEISHLEAKMNMWKAAMQDAKDPVRVAYCQSRVAEVAKRLALVRESGGLGAETRASGDALAQLERLIVDGADIVVTTLASAYTHKTKVLKRRIALCIIDEAGQAIEPETLIPLMLDITHLTLIGDPQQLPGFICSQRARKHGLGESLFARLTSSAERWVGAAAVVLLDRQYRMHADIIDYPNRAFYDSKIHSVAPQRPPVPVPPYCIISISSGNKGQGSSGGNELEAMGVARLALALSMCARAQRLSLAVVTPYHAHKDLIRKNLAALHQHGAEVEVNTVDSFQGQERDLIVVSLARSHGVGFLTSAGRMNVMLTRARHALLICLNPHAVMKNDQWRTLIEDAQRRNMFKSLPTKLCQPLSPDEAPTDDILKYLYPNLNE